MFLKKVWAEGPWAEGPIRGAESWETYCRPKADRREAEGRVSTPAKREVVSDSVQH